MNASNDLLPVLTFLPCGVGSFKVWVPHNLFSFQSKTRGEALITLPTQLMVRVLPPLANRFFSKSNNSDECDTSSIE
jgi:hypothetical protein